MVRRKEEKTKAHDPITDDEKIRLILEENDRRNTARRAKFNPVTGEGSTGERVKVEIPDFPLPVQYL